MGAALPRGGRLGTSWGCTRPRTDHSVDARSGSGGKRWPRPAGRRRERNSHCSECPLARAQAVSPWKWKRCGNLLRRHRPRGPGCRDPRAGGSRLTVHDKSVFSFCEMRSGREGGFRSRSGLSQGFLGKARRRWPRLLGVWGRVFSCIPEASWEFLGDVERTPGSEGSCAPLTQRRGQGRDLVADPEATPRSLPTEHSGGLLWP